MAQILGLDIGGANTKYVLLDAENNHVINSGSDYFPFWKKYQEYPTYLSELKKRLLFKEDDYLVLVTTAELADCFETKKEGIETICKFVGEVFNKREMKNEPLIFDVNGNFHDIIEAGKYWLEVSAANWFSTARYLAPKYPNSIILDIGSTTTDFISIYNGKVVAKGKNDLERLITHELLYTGLLRTNVATIVHEVKLGQRVIPTASELFATTGDVYLLLGMISEEKFNVETADGKPPTIRNAMIRLARILCSDINQLSNTEIRNIAQQIKDKQIEMISKTFTKILQNYHWEFKLQPNIILIGSGSKPIGIPLLRQNGIYEQILMDDIFDEKISTAYPAYAVARIFNETLKNK